MAYSEAPMLTDLVQLGELPPVAERLPHDPPVVEVLDRIGNYGGELRTVTPISGWLVEETCMMYEPLLRFAPDGMTIRPNLARAWELSEDGRSIVIYLHEGLRWSDGVPVTTEDVLFAWRDVLLNKEITPILHSTFVVGGEPMKLDILDPFRFRLNFKEPYGSILYSLLYTSGSASLIQPKHYLGRYHPRYSPLEKIEKQAKEHGFDHWFELFRDMNHTAQRINGNTPIEYPTLKPWRVIDGSAIGHVILERNPYYWKVDAEGNQLPYIDRIHSTYVGNPEARNLKYIAGEVDFAQNPMENAPLLLANRERGKYAIRLWRENQGTRVTYYFNHTHDDPGKRRIFQDRRFRIALSLAINRKEINDVLYYGKCIPRQCTVNRACSFFEPEFETSYAEYDPDRGNRLLDEVGLERKGPGGWRHMPDGRQLIISADVIEGGFRPETTELVADHWAALGILLSWRVTDNELVYTRLMGNMFDVAIYPDDVATDPNVIRSEAYRVQWWAPSWWKWLSSNGRNGEEPPEDVKQLWQDWVRLRQTPDDGERIRLGKKILRQQAENLYAIGAIGGTMNLVLVTDRMKNVPGDGALIGSPWLVTALHHPEQFFLSEQSEVLNEDLHDYLISGENTHHSWFTFD